MDSLSNNLAETQESAVTRMIQNHVRDFSVFTTDPGGHVTSWNVGSEEMFGYSGAEIMGRNLDILFTPEDRAAGVPALERTIALAEGCARDERWHLRKNGERFYVSGAVRPIRQANGEVEGYIKIGRDLTERCHMEAALRRAEEETRVIMENVKDFAIIGLDVDSRITSWNPGAELLFGYTAEEIRSQRLEILFTPEDRARRLPQQEIAAASEYGRAEMDHWLLRKTGEKFFANQAIRPVVDGEGAVRGFIKVARDITRRKRTEERLEETVADRTKDLQATIVELESFSYSMSHDLRAPLRAIISFSQLVAPRVEELGAPVTEYIARIMTAANRMDRLIQDILVYSRLGRHNIELKPIPLEPLLKQIIAEHPSLQSPAAEVVIDSPLLSVQGHEASLTQCIYNLLGNAVKFVETGVIPRVRIWTEQRDAQVRVWFEDNGIGIPEEHQGRIFGMFQRLHRESSYPGTGIGLTVVRKAIERMAGSVGVEPVSNNGSRFWIQLPGLPEASG